MGDPSQTDMFEEATYVEPKYLQLHDSRNDFDVINHMYLKTKEDMSAEELRKVVDDILQELKDYEGELAKKDKGYTGRTIQVEKSGTGELIRELQKTIAEQERETYKLDNRIQELQKRIESLKKSK
jgi:polyhydroxyalkanoate synthesis regulator phasin